MGSQFQYGGQAVIEGVMMRGPDSLATALRRKDGSIELYKQPFASKAKKGTFLGLPLVRGFVSLIEMLVIGMKTITLSANRAELDVKPDLWFFACHFQGDPVMPGCLGLDAMWQLIGFYLTWLQLPGRGRALGAGEVKFTGEVGPDVKRVTYEIDIKRVIKRKLVMAIGDARLLADGKEIYVANDLRVGLFKREEDAAKDGAPQGEAA